MTVDLESATVDEARLLVEYARWAIEWEFHPANTWFRSDDFDPEPAWYLATRPGDPGRLKVLKILGYYETLGLYHRLGLIHPDLLLGWIDYVGPWERVGAIALAAREERKLPELWENFERLAEAQRQWLNASRGAETKRS